MPFWNSDKGESVPGNEQDPKSGLPHEMSSATEPRLQEPRNNGSVGRWSPSRTQPDFSSDEKAPPYSMSSDPSRCKDGAEASRASQYAPPTAASSRTQFASISMHRYDRLRILDFPPPVIDLLRDVIQQTWPKGIQSERIYADTFEFKFKGNPWWGKVEDVNSRRMMTTIFAALFEQGWLLAFSTEISRLHFDPGTVLFRYQTPAPAPHEWMCVVFMQRDRLLTVDAPPALCEAVASTIADRVQSREPNPAPGVFELKLLGIPWNATGEETMHARRLLLQLLNVLEAHGFSVYSSLANKVSGDDGGRHVDTWHCCRRVGWQPGEPVIHR